MVDGHAVWVSWGGILKTGYVPYVKSDVEVMLHRKLNAFVQGGEL